jgi:hypothetical protein
VTSTDWVFQLRWGNTKKAPNIQGFDEICRLMSSLGITAIVDDIGLEIDRFHQVRMRSVT